MSSDMLVSKLQELVALLKRRNHYYMMGLEKLEEAKDYFNQLDEVDVEDPFQIAKDISKDMKGIWTRSVDDNKLEKKWREDVWAGLEGKIEDLSAEVEEVLDNNGILQRQLEADISKLTKKIEGGKLVLTPEGQLASVLPGVLVVKNNGEVVDCSQEEADAIAKEEAEAEEKIDPDSKCYWCNSRGCDYVQKNGVVVHKNCI